MKADRHAITNERVRETVAYVLRLTALAEVLLSNCGTQIKLISRNLMALCGLRPEIEHPMDHITFSPSKADRSFTRKCKRIARRIRKKLRLPRGWPIVVVLHHRRGTKHEPHLHILLPLINDAGVRLVCRPTEFQLMQIAQEIEKEFDLEITPGLEKADPFALRLNYYARKRFDAGRLTEHDKARLAMHQGILAALGKSNGDFEAFLKCVKDQGIEALLYTHNAKLCGIGFRFNGLAVSGGSLAKGLTLGRIFTVLESKRTPRQLAHKEQIHEQKTTASKIPETREPSSGQTQDHATIEVDLASQSAEKSTMLGISMLPGHEQPTATLPAQEANTTVIHAGVEPSPQNGIPKTQVHLAPGVSKLESSTTGTAKGSELPAAPPTENGSGEKDVPPINLELRSLLKELEEQNAPPKPPETGRSR